jgi:hypothetical protein
MKQPTKAQLETFVDFAYHQHKAESWDRHAATALVKDNDHDEYVYRSHVAYKEAFVAVNIARDELGMTNKQIDKCCHLLICWAEAHEEIIAAKALGKAVS